MLFFIIYLLIGTIVGTIFANIRLQRSRYSNWKDYSNRCDEENFILEGVFIGLTWIVVLILLILALSFYYGIIRPINKYFKH